MSLLDRARPELRALKGYSSARMEASGGRVLLNANESPWASAADHDGSLNRYPDPQPAALRERLAALYGVPADALLVGRGSDEAIDLLTRAFCRAGVDSVLVSPPTFGMYAVCAEVQGAAVIRVPLRAGDGFALDVDAVLAAVRPDTKIVYVCTPNNPTGDLVPAADVRRLAAALEGRALVVVDEAYAEFADAPSFAAEAALAGGNLAVLRTLSKAHALAGARIGVLIADPAIIGLCRRIMAPYPLPQPCVLAAERALSPDALAATRLRVASLVRERERLRGDLPAIPGVREVFPSQANFLTVRLDDAANAYRALLARGIVLRDVSHYPGLADCLRISIGTPAENDAVLAALAATREAA
ncbi:MAG: histidinol-phosphate transaminase [Pseudomonadota bacterium]